MNQRLISTLEREIEDAIADVMEGLEDRLPFAPESPALHAMAKAAVTVYEAVADHESGPTKRRK